MESDRTREDAWFRDNEAQLLEAAQKARAKRLAEHAAQERAEERARLKQLHFMCCPKCGHALNEQQLDGLAVDVCSDCEGVFFDAGELERLFLKRDAERKGLLGRLLRL